MDSQVSFSAFCNFIDQIRRLPSVEFKKTFIRDFIDDWKRKDANIYSLLRLLITKMDRKRSIPIKEAKITDLYLTALGVAKTSPDAARLREWNVDAGKDFTELLEEFLVQRCTLESSDTKFTIKNANEILDSLREETDKLQIIRAMALELPVPLQLCLVRLVLKEMKLGMPDTQVLKAIHPRAPDAFYANSDLEALCTTIASGKDLDAAPSLRLFHPVAPMLATRQDLDKTMDSITKELSKFRLEAKVDGERVQLHTDRERFTYFSRNGADYSHLYGLNAMTGPLSVNLVDCFDSSVEEIILDGEMIMIDEGTGEFIPFGVSKTSSDHKGLSVHACYVVFDILYLNGSSLLEYSLEERINLLKAHLGQKSYYLHFVETWNLSTFPSIKEVLQASLNWGYEGLMVKRLDSKYFPALRSKEWVKMKPDYFDTLALDVDLVIIAADSGRVKSSSAKGLSTFTCAARCGDGLWRITSRVGSGFNMMELNRISEQLDHLLEPFDKNKEYPWLTEQFPTSLRPNYIVTDPSKAPVMQIKAHGLVKTDVYPLGQTLRFPRFTRLRPDRTANDCTTIDEIISWKLPEISFDSFLGEDHQQQSKKKRRVTRKPSTVVSWTRTKDVGTSGSLFSGLDFYVATGDGDRTKQDIEKLLIENGAKITQNPKLPADVVVLSGQRKGIRVDNLIKVGFCVLEVRWAIECIEKGSLVGTDDMVIAVAIPQNLLDKLNSLKDQGQRVVDLPASEAETDSEMGSEIEDQDGEVTDCETE